MSEDKRVNFIVNNIASLCQLDDDVDRISKLKSFASKSKEITSFLDDQRLLSNLFYVLKNRELYFLITVLCA